MTRKAIFYHMEGSPLMQSLRRGTLEQLTTLRNQLNEYIHDRKRETWTSFSRTALGAFIGSSIGILLTEPSFECMILGYALGLGVCTVYWCFTLGLRFRRAKMMEKVLTTLIDAAIWEKQIPLQKNAGSPACENLNVPQLLHLAQRQ